MTTAALLLYRVTAPLLLLACDALTLPMHPATPHALRATAPRMLFGGGGKGGEGGGLNMMETIKKAQQVGVKVKALQEELAQTEIEAISADGGCTVVISGAQVPISVDVTEALLAKGSKAVSEAGAKAPSPMTSVFNQPPFAKGPHARAPTLDGRSERRCQGGAYQQRVVCPGANGHPLRRNRSADSADTIVSRR